MNDKRHPADQGTTAKSKDSSLGSLIAIMAAVFIVFLVMGMALPVLPLYVNHGLGFGAFMVGIVEGSRFATSLLSRLWSGDHTDRRGPKRAFITGLAAAIVAGLLYLLSLSIHAAGISVFILLLGRAALGIAESLVTMGALIWGLALAGPEYAGRIMAWVGTAMYAAYAVGAPAGTTLYADYGFIAISFATIFIPLISLLLVAFLHHVAPKRQERPPFKDVASAVWIPGSGLALSAVGFGAITTFIALIFSHRGWSSAWIAFTALSVAFILGRVALGHLPDRIGGARIALVFAIIEAAGQAMIWLASSPILVFVGASFTGLGYSLVYPSLGLEAFHRASRRTRGIAMGAYTAFLDLSLGVANPALGWVAGQAGLDSVFLVSTILVLGSAAIAFGILRAKKGLPAKGENIPSTDVNGYRKAEA